jgi:hypothetical protein
MTLFIYVSFHDAVSSPGVIPPAGWPVNEDLERIRKEQVLAKSRYRRIKSKSFRTVVILPETGPGHHKSASLECYRYTNLLGNCVVL